MYKLCDIRGFNVFGRFRNDVASIERYVDQSRRLIIRRVAKRQLHVVN